MGKCVTGLMAALAATAVLSSAAATQPDRASPLGREEAMFEFLAAELAAQRG